MEPYLNHRVVGEKNNPQHLIYHSRTYRRGKEWTMTLMVIKTLERVSKNYYYIIRGENTMRKKYLQEIRIMRLEK